MKWIKTSDRMPDLEMYSESELHFKFDGLKPDGVQFFSDGFEIHKGGVYTGYRESEYHRLEWLDESEEQGDGVVAFLEWVVKRQWKRNPFSHKWYNEMDDPCETTAELYELFKSKC